MNLKIGDRISYRNKKGQVVKTLVAGFMGDRWIVPTPLPGDLLKGFIHVDDLIAPF